MGLLAGPVLFALTFFLEPFEGLNQEANAVLAATFWIATWWLTEAIPIPVTALLPIAIFPLTGAASIGQTTAAYGDKMLFLFIGGFIVAIAMQKWNLHKRIALNIIYAIGSNVNRILLGFMIATSLLSMWISNTATTLMMVTIGTALISQIQESSNETSQPFFKSLLLGIAYSASIGGVATLVGTPTNPIFVAVAKQLYGSDFSFARWMSFALPFSIVTLGICWILLARLVFRIDRVNVPLKREHIKEELLKLGAMSYEEKVVASVFISMAALWMSRSFILDQLVPGLSDTVIAISTSSLLFLIPSKKDGKPILTWEEAEKLPWGVIILFGGGLSIAAAFQSSELADWLGNRLATVQALPVFFIILIITFSINFLTEVTSNVATASIMLPVLASLAEAIGIHPFLLMIPATMAASCAFMLPIATAPNAIVFASGKLEIKDMIRPGIWLNVISSFLISLLVYLILPSFL